MARHNEVTLYGTVMESPKLLYNTSDVHDPNRKLVRTIGILSVLRGIRDFGAVDKRIRIDLPIILSQNEKMMKAISAWKTGDVILMRGTLATVNYTLTLKCPHCGAPEAIPATMTFVNPIYMKKECESLAPEESNREMRRNAEISNRVTIIGKVCTPPTLFITDKGQRIANYQLDVMRKYRIKEDQETNKHDFPFVKSYGVVADNDVLAIQEGGMVFVDGAIQTREYLKNHQCPTCGETYQYKDTATEIVPYSTEYLTGCKTMEEIEEIKQQRAIEEGKLARAEIFGEDDNLDADDVDVDE
ncbi:MULTISPECIES: single-stranded DNA-binding protein [Clostridiaceae]|uniref:single-stranded DNA-binding protein n=1 Tax=Clostridiaceae TaxID=31979 RepID=UPI001C033C5D|nr:MULTISPECIES: single-stranded DNA-binding protein [Clostridia]MBT9820254.1 single-stranded DNA-binding protein [Clostridium sp. MCC328]MBT9830196.1 single-stranded DNA-binding protein [Enterocloster bolteae]